MEGLCSKCGAHLVSPWKFCPGCGAAITHEVHHMPPPPEEKAPLMGAFGGFFLGTLVAPMMIIVGTMLCLTGLGAFAGVPMIIVGILAPLLGPQFGYGMLKGKCPWCGATIRSGMAHAKGFYCHACSNRIVIQDRKFVRATVASRPEIPGPAKTGTAASGA
jgi:DNA-directed RNA polymerase subunit RPC12/RpoP